jgi:leucyl aminopeptidase
MGRERRPRTPSRFEIGMNISFAAKTLPETGSLVVLAGAGGALPPTARALDERLGGTVRKALDAAGSAFKRGSVIDLAWPAGSGLEHLLILGLGKPEEATPFDLESAGGALALKLKELGVKAAAVAVDEIESLACCRPAEIALCLATGARLRSWRFLKYRTQREEDNNREVEALAFLLDAPDEAASHWRRVDAVSEGVLHARELVSEPANVLFPKAFAEACRALGEETGLDVQILEPAALSELGMRALLAVGQGSAREPYVAVLRWPGGPEGEPPVALVGKGVCFDTGGISIKPAAGMEEMKWDMGGAGAVFGAMKALALRKAKANVVGVLGLVENMPSGTAQRPGDVVTTMSGLTVEVINTDAEGRLVLADLLHYTLDRFEPKVMVDLATLTGAIIVALGHEQAGLFASDDDLARQLEAAGAAVGDKLWRMPLGKEYAEHVKSEIADLKNVGRAREAGATAGAVFLERFAGKVPWAHLDIAGTTWAKRDLPLAAKGATGFGVRLLERWIAQHHEG